MSDFISSICSWALFLKSPAGCIERGVAKPDAELRDGGPDDMVAGAVICIAGVAVAVTEDALGRMYDRIVFMMIVLLEFGLS